LPRFLCGRDVGRGVIAALTGTPGVGKTTVARGLEKKGFDVLDLHEMVDREGLATGRDDERDTLEVDMDALKDSVLHWRKERDGDTGVVEGHLSHLMPVDRIIVLRLNPAQLSVRLISRGWKPEKVKENCEAEAVDVILIESVRSGCPVDELDGTNLSPEEVVRSVEMILEDAPGTHPPGGVDWSGEVMDWY